MCISSVITQQGTIRRRWLHWRNRRLRHGETNSRKMIHSNHWSVSIPMRGQHNYCMGSKPTDSIRCLTILSFSLYRAVEMLCESHVHRLPVMEKGTGNISYILTHKRIIKFLSLYVSITIHYCLFLSMSITVRENA